NGSAELTTPGAAGGALGYAQRTGTSQGAPTGPGVNAGFLGIGLDAFGNFANDYEGRGGGCATAAPLGTGSGNPGTSNQAPNTVTLRGPGQRNNQYCWLITTPNLTTLTGGSANTLSTGRNGTLAASKRTVRITITPNPNPTVEVEIDFGSGYRTVL